MSNNVSDDQHETPDQGFMISMNGVTKTYPGGTIGIENLTFDIRKGEIFGFLGQNGAGKTTCIRCILNILIPDDGSITVDGEIISRQNPEIREKIGYLPGELNIPGYYKVKDFLDYMANLRDRPSDRMEEIVEIFELPTEKKVDELSKGNKQKIGIISAFMHNPEILILDEPTSGLDPIYQQRLYDLILTEKQKGKTIFFSSHNLDEVQRICDRVGIIREGKLVTIENVKDLSDKLSRNLVLFFNDLTEEALRNIELNFNVIGSNLVMNEVRIEVKDFREFSTVVEKVKALPELRDIAYPPASLESFFMSKYRED